MNNKRNILGYILISLVLLLGLTYLASAGSLNLGPNQGTLIPGVNPTNATNSTAGWISWYYGPDHNFIQANVTGPYGNSISITSNTSNASIDVALFAPSNSFGIGKTGLNFSLSGVQNFYFWFYIQNASELSGYNKNSGDGIDLILLNSSNPTYLKCPIYSASIENGWTPVVMAISDCVSPNGNINWTTVTSMVFAVNFNPNVTKNITVNFDDLRYNYGGGLFNKAQVILTFDGGWDTTATTALPIMRPNHQSGVAFLVTNQITAPNNQTECNPESPCVTVGQLKELYANGWDIASHTVDHANLLTNSTPNDIYQLSGSYNTLLALNFTRSADLFAYPNGAYDAEAINLVSSKSNNYNYTMARALGFGITQPNMYQSNPYNLSYEIQSVVLTTPNVSAAKAESYINQTIQEKGLLVLTFHVITNSTSSPGCINSDMVCYSTADFANISNYLRQQECDGKLQVTTFSSYYNVVNSGVSPSPPPQSWCIPINVSVIASNTQIDKGQNVTFTAQASGGTGPYNYTWYSGSTCGVGNVITTNTVYTTPTLASNTEYCVRANDSFGAVGTGIAKAIVNPLPELTITPSSYMIDAGQNVIFADSVTHGTAPYTYSYATTAVNSVITGSTIEFQKSGTYNVTGYVLDARGANVPSNAVSITVRSAPKLTLTPSSTSIYTGQTVTFSYSATGGTPTYTYSTYNVMPGINGTDYMITGNSIQFNTAGTYVVSETVTDLLNATSSDNASIIVGTPSAPSGGGGSFTGGGTGVGGPITVTLAYTNSSPNQTGDKILNFTQKGTSTFVIGGKTFSVTLNFITPTSVGITVNGHNYTINDGQTQLLNDPPGYAYYAKLMSISYIPIIHTANLEIYGAPISSGTTNTISNTTTQPATTTIPMPVAKKNVTTATAPQASQSEGTAASTPSSNVKPPSSTDNWLIGGIVVLIVLIIAIYYFFGRGKKPKSKNISKKNTKTVRMEAKRALTIKMATRRMGSKKDKTTK